MSLSDSLSSVLHTGSQYLLVPTMVALIVLVLVAVFCLGHALVEYFNERRHFKVNHRDVIASIHDADYVGIGQVIQQADLLKTQVTALMNIADNMGLPEDELFALTQVELERADKRYRFRVNLTDTVAKIAPLIGLMGTLIPLGPGIVAMGQGEVAEISSALMIAFDTTIVGIVAAVIATIISRVRRTWYGQYATMMRTLSACLLTEAENARAQGVSLPYGGPQRDLFGEAEGARAKRGRGGRRGAGAAAPAETADAVCEGGVR